MNNINVSYILYLHTFRKCTKKGISGRKSSSILCNELIKIFLLKYIHITKHSDYTLQVYYTCILNIHTLKQNELYYLEFYFAETTC